MENIDYSFTFFSCSKTHQLHQLFLVIKNDTVNVITKCDCIQEYYNKDANYIEVPITSFFQFHILKHKLKEEYIANDKSFNNEAFEHELQMKQEELIRQFEDLIENKETFIHALQLKNFPGCPYHPDQQPNNQKCKFYCYECDTFLCQQCYINNHIKQCPKHSMYKQYKKETNIFPIEIVLSFNLIIRYYLTHVSALNDIKMKYAEMSNEFNAIANQMIDHIQQNRMMYNEEKDIEDINACKNEIEKRCKECYQVQRLIELFFKCQICIWKYCVVYKKDFTYPGNILNLLQMEDKFKCVPLLKRKVNSMKDINEYKHDIIKCLNVLTYVKLPIYYNKDECIERVDDDDDGDNVEVEKLEHEKDISSELKNDKPINTVNDVNKVTIQNSNSIKELSETSKDEINVKEIKKENELVQESKSESNDASMKEKNKNDKQKIKEEKVNKRETLISRFKRKKEINVGKQEIIKISQTKIEESITNDNVNLSEEEQNDKDEEEEEEIEKEEETIKEVEETELIQDEVDSPKNVIENEDEKPKENIISNDSEKSNLPEPKELEQQEQIEIKQSQVKDQEPEELKQHEIKEVNAPEIKEIKQPESDELKEPEVQKLKQPESTEMKHPEIKESKQTKTTELNQTESKELKQSEVKELKDSEKVQIMDQPETKEPKQIEIIESKQQEPKEKIKEKEIEEIINEPEIKQPEVNDTKQADIDSPIQQDPTSFPFLSIGPANQANTQLNPTNNNKISLVTGNHSRLERKNAICKQTTIPSNPPSTIVTNNMPFLSMVEPSIRYPNYPKIVFQSMIKDVKIPFGSHVNQIKCAIILQNDNLAVCGSYPVIKVFDLKKLKCIIKYKGHTKQINSVCKYGENEFLSCSDDHTVCRWLNVESNSLLNITKTKKGKKAQKDSLEYHRKEVLQLLQLEDNIALSCSEDGTIRQWDFRAPNERHIELHKMSNNDIPKVLIKINTKNIMIITNRKQLHIFNIEHKTLDNKTIQLPSDSILSPHSIKKIGPGKLLVGRKCGLSLYDLKFKSLLYEIKEQSFMNVQSLHALNPNSFICAASKKFYVYNLEESTIDKEYEIDSIHKETPTCLAFVNFNRNLISVSTDSTIIKWKLKYT